MSQKEKSLAHFQNLYLLAMADEKLEIEEKIFLTEITRKLGLSLEDVSPIIDNYKNLDMIIPDTNEQRLFQLKDLVRMMLIDAQIHDDEYTICLRFAEKYGFSQGTLEGLIDQVLKEEKLN